jgi:hypothetical protein
VPEAPRPGEPPGRGPSDAPSSPGTPAGAAPGAAPGAHPGAAPAAPSDARPVAPTDGTTGRASSKKADETSSDTDVPPSPGKRPENGYWSVAKPRWFVSTKSDVGLPYLKPYFSAGYGLPHFIWAGVDLNSITTGEFTQIYAGIRASTPVFDLAFGYRDTWSFGKPFLQPRSTYTREDVLNAPGPGSRYWAWEAEAVGILPLPYSAIVGDVIVVRTLDVPSENYVFDESYRAVVAKPLFVVARVAAVARVLREGSLKIGPLVEHVFETGRTAPVTRIGPAFSLQFTDHLEAQAVLTLAVSSPDNLGLTLAAYGVLGLRYRWATGERAPKWPWNEQIIP